MAARHFMDGRNRLLRPTLRWPTLRWRTPRWPGLRGPVGLSARLLLLTTLFLLVAQLFILIPSLAGFEDNWLADRAHQAQVASLAVDASPTGVVSDELAARLLKGAGVVSVAVQTKGVIRLPLAAPRMEQAPALVDLRSQSTVDFLLQPFITLGPGAPRMLRVRERPDQELSRGDFIEIVLRTAPLRADLWAYLVQVVLVSVLISAIAGIVVYLLLASLLVQPIRRITLAMERFRARPEDPTARLEPSGRRDEIGRAELELDRMQEELVASLQSRARLAALGEAVAKINHDLRNMLTSAQIASERLASSTDPRVAQAMPRLERALGRAVKLAEGVLAYGRSEEPAPQPSHTPLRAALEAAAEDAGLTDAPPGGGARLSAKVPDDMTLYVDADQVHRLLVNLFRNAREAIAAAGSPNGPGVVRVSATAENGVAALLIADNGPGVPERVQARLFQPFSGSGRAEGTGLGLAIARELARAHGGELALIGSSPKGATFELKLPLVG
jgi:signal transduction histidine kinase